MFSKSEGGSPTLSTTTSTLPLLAISPNAAPRRDFSGMSARPAGLRNFFERSVAQIAMQKHGLGVSGASLHVVHLRIDVSVDNEQIEPAVVVHVEERCSPADQRQARLAKPRRHRHIFESSRSLIAIQSVGLVGKFRDEHGETPAVIVVAPGHAHRTERLAFAVHGNAADHRVVGERAVVIVVIEMIGRRVVGDEQIGPAVVVVVTPGRAEAIVFVGIARRRPSSKLLRTCRRRDCDREDRSRPPCPKDRTARARL